MTGHEFIHGLLSTSMSGGVAMLAVLLLRKPVRCWLGASAAYLLWLAVPTSLLAMLLPAPRVDVTVMSAVGHAVQTGVAAADVQAACLPWPSLLAIGWLAGAVLMAFVLLRQQRCFVHGLGRLQRRDDGCWQAQATAGLPALIGLWKPRIVLPAGFDQLYSTQEQRLVLLHERTHLRRGDVLVNALLAALQCIYWFNPLLPLALRRCREDQEFSCDERVLAGGEGARRSYGNAMLKTGLALSPLPVGCYWQNHHPLKERIAMLKRPVPGKKQWLAMGLLSAGLSAGVACVAWAAQPGQVEEVVANATYYSVKLHVDVDGEVRDFEVREREGKPFGFSMKAEDGNEWSGEFTLDKLYADKFTFSGTLNENGEMFAMPSLSVKNGHEANIGASNRDGSSVFKMAVVVEELAGDAAVSGAEPAPEGRISVEPMDAPASTPGLASMSPPRYPASMNTGEVVLKIDVAVDGSVAGVVVDRSSGHADLDEAAAEAARKWKFNPAQDHGKAIAGQLRVPVRFEKDPAESTSEDRAS